MRNRRRAQELAMALVAVLARPKARRRRKARKPVHWTRRPENAGKVRKVVRAMHRGRR